MQPIITFLFSLSELSKWCTSSVCCIRWTKMEVTRSRNLQSRCTKFNRNLLICFGVKMRTCGHVYLPCEKRVRSWNIWKLLELHLHDVQVWGHGPKSRICVTVHYVSVRLAGLFIEFLCQWGGGEGLGVAAAHTHSRHFSGSTGTRLDLSSSLGSFMLEETCSHFSVQEELPLA